MDAEKPVRIAMLTSWYLLRRSVESESGDSTSHSEIVSARR